MFKKMTFLSLLLLSNFSLACEHLGLGLPKQSDQVNCLSGYAIGYNYKLKAADWVAYKLVKQTWVGVDRQDDFREDLSIPEQYRTNADDYDEPVYDQGHLANSESIDASIQANSETFLYSNIVPQLGKHNRSIWKGLENRERKWAERYGEVWVYTAGLYRGKIQTIGKSNVPIPSDFWKIIYVPSKQKVIAFLIPHKPLKTAQLKNYVVSVDKVEAETGLDLLSDLPDHIEYPLEATTSKFWR